MSSFYLLLLSSKSTHNSFHIGCISEFYSFISSKAGLSLYTIQYKPYFWNSYNYSVISLGVKSVKFC